LAGDPAVSREQLRELTARAHAAVHRADWPEAALLWGQVVERFPGHISAYVSAANALRACGELDAAERILARAAELFPGHGPVAVARGWTANARRDWPEALGRWEDVCARFPALPQGYNGMAQALRGAGRGTELEPFLAAAQARITAVAAAVQDGTDWRDAAFEVARLRADWPGVRDWAEQIIARDAAPAAAVFAGLAQACWHLEDADAAAAAAERALAINPALMDALLVLVRVVTARGDGEATLSLYQRLAALNPNASAWPLKRVQLLNWLGYLDESLDEAAQLLARWPDDPMVRVFLRNFGLAASLLPQLGELPAPGLAHDPDAAERNELQSLAAGAPAAGARAVIDVDPRRDVIIPDGSRAATAVLVFTGTNDAVAMPLPLFDRYMAPLDLTPVYLRDFHRLRYLAGIRALGGSYEETIGALRRMLRERGFSRIYALGNCAGGFAAMRYGVELGAERILVFDAPSFCPDEALTRLDQGQNFMRTRLQRRFGEDMTDLKPFLAARKSAARIDVFYQIEDPKKRIHAERLADVPGVRLHAEPGLGDNRLLRRIALESENFSAWLAGLMPEGRA
jgi:tetratricopeptide (TPR) repeat protein